MGNPVNTGYAHRFNRDGTIDSICRQCFMTVAKVRRESDLEACEREHLCYSQYMLPNDEDEMNPSN